jgi:two-component system, sensor histidine kinase PdtaS
MGTSNWRERALPADTSVLPDDRTLNTDERRALVQVSVELRAARSREAALLQEMADLAQRQVMLAHEFEHRLINGLQLISSLLSLQSRAAASPDAAGQLAIAAQRVSALGRVHRRLHLLDHQDHVEFKPYLQHLCEDLSRLLCEDAGDCAILVESATVEIPTSFAIPLGFIVNELITNAVKYAKGNITVRFGTSSAGHALSVTDEGPGLPPGFKPVDSKGLGMKIVLALVKQIGGALHVGPGDGGHGTRMVVTFGAPAAATNGRGDR